MCEILTAMAYLSPLMTIPSRPAPPPPKSIHKHKATKEFLPPKSYEFTNSCDEYDLDYVYGSGNVIKFKNEKNPPPRPPPPK
ncbi:hypothetical protein Bhyg_17295, partial [Pseudolycoriella hygida]